MWATKFLEETETDRLEKRVTFSMVTQCDYVIPPYI